MAETDNNTDNLAIFRFRVKADEIPNPSTRMSFEKAVDSFSRFIGDSPLRVEAIDERLVSEWVSWLFGNGYSYNTVVYYVNRLSSLHGKIAKDISMDYDGFFSRIKQRLKHISARSLEIYSVEDCFDKLRRLVLTDNSGNAARQLAKDVVLFSLYNGGLSFGSIVKYRKDGYQGSDDAVKAIVERYSKPKNKYLFPLNQSEHTPRQLEGTVSALFANALKGVGIRLAEYGPSVSADLWIMTAMRCGFAVSDIAACLEGDDNGSPILMFASGGALPDDRKSAIRSRMVRVLSKDPEEWYAMQFRPHVDYDQIQQRLASEGIRLTKIFYPMEEIVRQAGKKLRKQTKPVVPGLMFFQSKVTRLPGLYYRIGDLAWGYRYSRTPGSPYAVIPPEDIEMYQLAVGQFVDSIESYPEGAFSYERGDKVEITSGDFRGYPAFFEKEIREVSENGKTTTRIINRLRLAGIEQYSWIVDLDPRMMVKITDDRFDILRQHIG